MTARAAIRAAAKNLIEAGPHAFPVITARLADVAKFDDYFRLYFGDGFVDFDQVEPETVATFLISYGSTTADDDSLDSVLNEVELLLIHDIQEKLNAELVLIGSEPVLYMLRTSFEYGVVERTQHSELTYTYQIRYGE